MRSTMLFAAVAAVAMETLAYAPAKSPLMTEWGEKMTPESALSGVGRLVEPDEFLWYTRRIEVKKIGQGQESGGEKSPQRL